MADENKWFTNQESYTNFFETEAPSSITFYSTLTIADEAIDNFSMTKLGIKNGFYRHDAEEDPYSVMVMEDIPFSYYEMMKDLNHRNILGLENYCREKSLLITDRIDGTLESYVKAKAEELFFQEKDGSYSLSESFKILIRDILEGLRYLQSMGVYHNNMHLKNTFVTESGNKIWVKLFHFKGRDTTSTRQIYMRGIEEDWKNLKNLIKECYDVHEYQPSSIVRSFFKFLDGNLVTRSTIFEHPIFWENDMDKRCYLFWVRNGSNALRVKSALNNSTLLQWPNDEWINLIVEEENKRGETSYSMASPYDFVRLIDNKLRNCDELPDDFRCEYGTHEDAFLYYVEGLVPNIWEILFDELGPIAEI